MSRFTIKLIILLIFIAGLGFFIVYNNRETKKPLVIAQTEQISSVVIVPKALTLPRRKILEGGYHAYQTFNNCAPAALAIAFSYYGINKTQEELAEDLRPYNNLRGNNDDKSTPPPELADRAIQEGLGAYYRPNGDIEMLKRFIANDIPVVVRTLLYADKSYAHYRVIKGYDDDRGSIIQDDSLEGKNINIPYDKFMTLWQPFNYSYLVFTTPENKDIVEKIIGEELDTKTTWQKAKDRANDELKISPNNLNSRFNLVVANFYLGDHQSSVQEFEKIEKQLSKYTTWYQIEPIQAYFALNNHERVFSLSDKILNDNNRAFTELYLLRGHTYLKQSKNELAKLEFEKAVFYNKNSKEAREALTSMKN